MCKLRSPLYVHSESLLHQNFILNLRPKWTSRVNGNSREISHSKVSERTNEERGVPICTRKFDMQTEEDPSFRQHIWIRDLRR